MALSNWDTMALDLESKANTGHLKSPLGVEVEIYKNWLYVRDEHAWQKGGSFINPTVMEIRAGDITYKDVFIKAIRGPQQGIFCVVYYHPFSDEKDEDGNPYHDYNKYVGFVGCGVYGYDGDKFVGVKPESVKFLQDYLQKNEAMTHEEAIDWARKHCRTYDKEHPEGFAPEDEELENAAQMYMIPDWEFEEPIRKVNFDNAIRFNQGDEFFANNVDGLELSATKPGEPEKPVIEEFLKGIKK